MTHVYETLTAMWGVLAEMAPYLLLGFAVSGLLHLFITPAWVERHLGSRRFGAVAKASIFGVPMPLCSCGVIPVTASLRNHGASRGAAVSFLLSTPQTGVDSILATYALLGPVLAVFRPIVALATGLIGGGIVSWLEPDPHEHKETVSSGGEACNDGCRPSESSRPTWQEALRYGFVNLPGDIAKPLILGIVIAGIISAVIGKNALAPYMGGGVLSMLVMMAVSIPFYVCATASIPLAVGFIHMGVSPGAALVFLIAGPATNAATIGVVWKVLGRRTTVVYLATVAVVALLSGLGFNALIAALPQAGIDHSAHTGHNELGWLKQICAFVLVLILVYSLLPKKLTQGRPDMEEKPAAEFEVMGMSCSHCTHSVKRALEACKGVERAEVSLEEKRARVYGENLDMQTLSQAIANLGYGARSPI